jgi:hypothetical protein
VVERVGDLLAHLRWLGATKGELAVERRLERLVATPLLVLDDIDRAIRSRPSSKPLSLRGSCASHDLIRMARLLKERHASMGPIIVASRAEPSECAARLAAVTRPDLVRGLLGTALGQADPFEAFPGYSAGLLTGALNGVQQANTRCALELSQVHRRAA